MSRAQLVASRERWLVKEQYRARKYRHYRDMSKRPQAERDALISKWQGLYREARDAREQQDKQIAALPKPKPSATFAYRLGWRSVRAVEPRLSPAEARKIADALGPAFREYGITTPARAAAAVAQFAHESAGFRTTTEFASGAAYEGRRDLGNTRPGDGKRFRGRGYIQITGRSNYTAVSKAFGVDFLSNSSKLAEPRYAAKASCWWWSKNGCNQIADSGDFVALTRRINGGTNGLADRQTYHARARKVAKYLVPKRRPPV